MSSNFTSSDTESCFLPTPQFSSSSNFQSDEKLTEECISFVLKFKISKMETPSPLLRTPHTQTIWGARVLHEIFIPFFKKFSFFFEIFNHKVESLADYADNNFVPLIWRLPDVDDVCHVDFHFHYDSEIPYHSNLEEANDFVKNKTPPIREGSKGSRSSKNPPPLSSSSSDLSRPLVIIQHGLESSSRMPFSVRLAMPQFDLGYDIVLLNSRGCGLHQDYYTSVGRQDRNVRRYHIGYTNDLEFVIEKLHYLFPTRRIYLAGFSMGGNLICRILGRLGSEARKLNICGASVICSPFDCLGFKLDREPIGSLIYCRRLLTPLQQRLKDLYPMINQPNEFPTQAEELKRINYEAGISAKTIGDFDNAVTAPLWGFKNRTEYYNKSGCKDLLKYIKIPLLCINALDDPFFDSNYFAKENDLYYDPILESKLTSSQSTRISTTDSPRSSSQEDVDEEDEDGHLFSFPLIDENENKNKNKIIQNESDGILDILNKNSDDEFDLESSISSSDYFSTSGSSEDMRYGTDDKQINNNNLKTPNNFIINDLNRAPVLIVHSPYGGHCGFSSSFTEASEICWPGFESSRFFSQLEIKYDEIANREKN